MCPYIIYNHLKFRKKIERDIRTSFKMNDYYKIILYYTSASDSKLS